MIPVLLGLLLVGPVAYYGIRHLRNERQRKNRQVALANAYQNLVVQYRLLVDHYEIIGNRVLAFDRKNKTLLAIDHSRDLKQETCIPLLSIAETRIVEERNREGHVEQIFLQLKHRWSDLLYRICFFDHSCDDNVELPASARRASVWKNKIDNHKYPGPILSGQEFVL